MALVTLAMIFVRSVTLALENRLTVGMIVAFMSYKRRFADKAVMLVEKALEFRSLAPHIERLSTLDGMGWMSARRSSVPYAPGVRRSPRQKRPHRLALLEHPQQDPHRLTARSRQRWILLHQQRRVAARHM
jgi:hypothetical protein